MISVYKIKPAFQKLLRPLISGLNRMGITPNMVTVLAVVLSGVVGYLFWEYPNGNMLWILPISLLVRMALNAIDGMMATEYNLKSKLGEILNELGDIIADLLMFLPLMKLTGVRPEFVLLFVLLSMLNEYSGILTKAIGATRRYDGPMGKSDRALIIGLTCLVFYFFPETDIAANYIFSGMCILLMVSTYLRLRNGLREINS